MISLFFLKVFYYLLKQIRLLPVCILFLLPMFGFGQELETETYEPADPGPTFLLSIGAKYLENDRVIEESNYSDVHQKRKQTDVQGNLFFYLLNMEGKYKEYNASTKVDTEEIRFSGQQDNLISWIEFFNIVYLWGQQKNIHSDYKHTYDSTTGFFEEEKANFRAQGVGVLMDAWKFGFSPKTLFGWSYKIEVSDQVLVDDDIKFDLNVYEIARSTNDRKGAYFELGMKKWISQKAMNNRDGSFENLEGFFVFGYGFSEDSAFYIREIRSKGTIKLELASDLSSAKRGSKNQESLFGFRYTIKEGKSVVIEQQTLKETINFDNVSFSSTKESLEEESKIGIEFNHNFRLSLTIGKTEEKRDYTDKAILNQTTHFKQVDKVIGISMSLTFSD